MPQGPEPRARHEFDCCECGRHVVSLIEVTNAPLHYECGRHMISLTETTTTPLCATFLAIPGWYRDRYLREAIDPGHHANIPPYDR